MSVPTPQAPKCSEVHSKFNLFCLICGAPLGRRQSPELGGGWVHTPLHEGQAEFINKPLPLS